jgi:hypothetical protein
MTPGSVSSALRVGSSSEEESRDAALNFARPKSRILGEPDAVKATFSGLTSRCTTPFSWAAASPSAIWAAISTASAIGSGALASRVRSVSPTTSSVTA